METQDFNENDIIDKLRENYTGEAYPLEMEASMYIGAATHSHIRKKIVEKLTGRTAHASKCTFLYTARVLKDTFDQPTLF